MDLARPVTGTQLREETALRAAGTLFFILAAQFMLVIMLGASLAPGYDMVGGAISDLGVIDETAMLFNASLLVVGAANLAGGYIFYRVHRRAWVLALFVGASIGAVGAGLVPLDSGGLHGLSALLAFVCFNLQALAVATVVAGPMRVVSAVAGAAGLVFVVLMALGDSGMTEAFGPIGHGGTERMIVYPAMLWMLGLGGYLMAAGEASTHR